MANTTGEVVPKLVRSIWPATMLMALSAGMFVWSSGYNATARMVPMLVSGTMVVLAGIDVLSRLPSSGLDAVRDFWGADFRNPEMTYNPPIRQELLLAGIFIAVVIAMMTVGILPTVPVFIAAYMTVFGRRRWWESLIVATAVLLFVLIVFEVLLDYRLYRGVLFDERGFDSW